MEPYGSCCGVCTYTRDYLSNRLIIGIYCNFSNNEITWYAINEDVDTSCFQSNGFNDKYFYYAFYLE